MEPFIYTLITAADWRVAQTAGAYAGSADDRRDGFLHFSTAAQLRATAVKHRAGVADLWMIEADTAVLSDVLKWEAASTGIFPHLYAPLPLTAVRRALAVPLDAAGHHIFPGDIP